MPDKPQTQDSSKSTSPAARPVVKKFGAPDQIPEQFGVITQTEEHIQGIAPTEQVRKLLDAFGVPERNGLTLPFQHMKRAHGEVWSMRVEPEHTHSVEGDIVKGHQWTFMRQHPEIVGAAQ